MRKKIFQIFSLLNASFCCYHSCLCLYDLRVCKVDSIILVGNGIELFFIVDSFQYLVNIRARYDMLLHHLFFFCFVSYGIPFVVRQSDILLKYCCLFLLHETSTIFLNFKFLLRGSGLFLLQAVVDVCFYVLFFLFRIIGTIGTLFYYFWSDDKTRVESNALLIGLLFSLALNFVWFSYITKIAFAHQEKRLS